MNKQNLGTIYTIIAYIIWGFLPIYWKLVEHVPAGQILAHRIIWSFFLMIFVILLTNNWADFIKESKEIFSRKRQWMSITAAGFLISSNWFVYIWAVNQDLVVQASLGYYINPLISILLGIIILKESVTRGQVIAIIIAAIGVLYLTISLSSFPWIALFLATTFALYGLLKKTVNASAMVGLTIETMVVTPIALIYLFSLPATTQAFNFSSGLSLTIILLIGSGIMTATPLFLFAQGAKRISLSMLGFLQYIAPTIMLLIGVLLYKEPFTTENLIAFTLIWFALIIFMRSSIQSRKKILKRGN